MKELDLFVIGGGSGGVRAARVNLSLRRLSVTLDDASAAEDVAQAGLERMRRDPARAVMIGDSIHDAEAAHRAGIPAVLVSWGYTARPARELGADAVIDRFDALPDALGRLASG